MTVKVEGKTITVHAEWTNGPIAQMSSSDIIREMGLLGAVVKAAEKRYAVLKEGIDSRVQGYRRVAARTKGGFDESEYLVPAGANVLIAKWVTQARFDGERAKSEMGEEWYKGMSKIITFPQYSVKPAESVPISGTVNVVEEAKLEPEWISQALEALEDSDLA